jgi:phenylacetate-CoA ligase
MISTSNGESMAFWNKEMETLPREELEKLQLSLLKKQVRTMYDSSRFFHDRMVAAGVTPDDIVDFESFRKVPFMKKTDLRDNYPDRLFVRPYDEIVRIHVSSGTTGLPTIVGYTEHDLDEWAESLARGMVSFGVTKGDVVQNCHGYGLFTGGIGVHSAAEKVGATVIPAGTGNTARQIQLMRDLPVTTFAGTPSYLFHIADVCDSMGIDIRKDTKLKLAIAGGEPWSESMRQKIQKRTGVRAHNCYGASEFYGPLFLECDRQCGAHVWADICYMEILDKDGNPCADGERGEMVVTMLNKQAFPLIRYRIGDISSLDWEPCACGRTHPRLMRLSGRTDDMLVVRGINVFPSQIESVIGEMPFLSTFYHITLENRNYMDSMIVEVELNEASLTEDMIELGRMTHQLENRLKDILNIKADVKLTLPGTLKRFEGKGQHVTDNRNYE